MKSNRIQWLATKLQSIFKDITFDRNELSGAFGDIGTVIPLVVGVLLATGMDAGKVFMAYGLMQIITGLVYKIPMPVQPLKVVALIVITQKLSADILLCGGLAVGILMLVFTVSGLIDSFTKIIPKAVIRGIQFGLGLQLVMLSLKEYIPSERFSDYILVVVAFLIAVAFMGNRRIPPALVLIPAGIFYGMIFNTGVHYQKLSHTITVVDALTFENIVNGIVILALPQIPLSLGNSIFATSQLSHDLFPEKSVQPRKIAFTYSLMNIINPFIGGIAVCHGSGGMAGHYAFGGRTGGSVIIFGALMITTGFIFGSDGIYIARLFPLPLLGVILFFEALTLLVLIGDVMHNSFDLKIALAVAALIVAIPYGYVVGMGIGICAYYLAKWIKAEKLASVNGKA
ncbi:MAG TPA: putative sulfate/molybdate transporter [Spirochaetota bacterium]|nr:putative sulfate/molybdate transporter [Spirochaetota bacterium]HOM10170.1 putative sulfate/molybdate transporter [Spirochaetota bacterium]HPP50806.1 putative sulfate/molybdate transporter [Spirochaetota bacterium]